MKKRILSVIICMVMLASVMSVTAMAYSPDAGDGLFIDATCTTPAVYRAGKGTVIYEPQLDGDGKLVSATLTLRNTSIYNDSKEFYGLLDAISLDTGVTVTIVLEGRNNIIGDCCAICVHNGDLIITGAGAAALTSNSYYGIYVKNGDLYIQDTSLTIDGYSSGICGLDKVYIENSAIRAESVGYGLYSNDGLYIYDSDITAVTERYEGINVFDKLTVKNSELHITSEDEDGISAWYDIDIIGSKLTVRSGFDGIYAGESLKISENSKINSKAARYGILANDLSVDDSSVEAAGSTAALLLKNGVPILSNTALQSGSFGNIDRNGTTYYTALDEDGNIMTVAALLKNTILIPNIPENFYYLFDVEPTVNGSVDVDADAAKPGTTVTVTLTPDAGYEGSVTVTAEDGTAVAVTALGGGKYSFKMPVGDVTIAAKFTSTEELFDDIDKDDYFYDAAMWAYESSIIESGSFYPNADSTRAEIVTFLWRAAGSPEPETTENPFTDVSAEDEFYKAVLWAVEEGITLGMTDTTFAPYSTVTRGQAVTFLWRNEGSPAAAGEEAFTDVEPDDYFYSAVLWAVAEGVTLGTSDTAFSPGLNCTRAHIITFIYRTIA